MNIRARVAVQHCRGFEYLLPIATPFAFKRFVGFAQSALVEEEQFPQGIDRKVALNVLFLVYDCGRKSLFVRLPLEDFLLDGARRNEAVNKACRTE